MASGVSLRTTAFAPLYTASSWVTLVGQTGADAHRRNGDLATLGRHVPRLSNRDALALVFAWRNVAASVHAFDLWYTYALAALGWERAGDVLQVDDERAAAMFSDDYLASLWLAMHEAATTLDNARRDNPAIAVVDVWNEPTTIDDVNRALAADGGGADAAFKQPLPICKDKRTGKLRFPKPVRQPDGTIKDPDCEIVTVDDPITAIVKAIAKVLGRAAKPLAVVGGVYLGITLLDRRRRRARGRKRRHGKAARRRAR